MPADIEPVTGLPSGDYAVCAGVATMRPCGPDARLMATAEQLKGAR